VSLGASPFFQWAAIPPGPVAVLLGGGVESTALVKRFLSEGRAVVPIHVHCGLVWDDCETRYVRRFLESNAGSELASLVEIRLPLEDFLRGHWTVTGVNVPRAGASSADLEIPLRNLTLLSFALHRLRQLRNGDDAAILPRAGADNTHPATPVAAAGAYMLALGTTADNCYRDGSRAYFDKCEEVLSLDAGCPVRVLTPFIGLDKTQVIRSSDAATLEQSFSCVSPAGELHCGQCIKCGRRQSAFRAAGVRDPTIYANPSAKLDGAH
jgi:7-cyano-7-deazaguanine synthase